MGVEKIFNTHARNLIVGGILCNDFYGRLNGSSWKVKVPTGIVEYMINIMRDWDWGRGASSRTSYDEQLDSSKAVICIENNSNILNSILDTMDKQSISKNRKPRYNIFTTEKHCSIPLYGNNINVRMYSESVESECRFKNGEDNTLIAGDLQLLLIAEVDKDSKVVGGNVSFTLIANIERSDSQIPINYGCVAITLYGDKAIESILEKKGLEHVAKMCREKILSLLNMEPEHIFSKRCNEHIGLILSRGDSRYYQQ